MAKKPLAPQLEEDQSRELDASTKALTSLVKRITKKQKESAVSGHQRQEWLKTLEAYLQEFSAYDESEEEEEEEEKANEE